VADSPWICFACDWRGREEETVMAEVKTLPWIPAAILKDEGEARVPGERWRCCPECGEIVYQLQAGALNDSHKGREAPRA